MWQDMWLHVVCQRVKAEHKHPAGKLQSLEVPLSPWDDVAMDFVVGLPCTPKGRIPFGLS